MKDIVGTAPELVNKKSIFPLVPTLLRGNAVSGRSGVRESCDSKFPLDAGHSGDPDAGASGRAFPTRERRNEGKGSKRPEEHESTKEENTNQKKHFRSFVLSCFSSCCYTSGDGVTMSQKLQLPDAIYKALQQAAKASGTTPAQWVANQLMESGPTKESSGSWGEDWIDRDFLRTYALEADDSISLESVRRAMAKIPGRLVDDIRAERDAR